MHLQVTFIPESVEPICYDIIESVLKDKMYNDTMAQKWIDEICSRITKELVEMNKPFKYLGEISTTSIAFQHFSHRYDPNNILLCVVLFSLVSCTVMQKNGAGLHMRHSCFWDRTNDNTVIARWPSEKKKDPNARVVCIVTIFGVAY